jgi:tetratricopeptide (TPR) repeat protein
MEAIAVLNEALAIARQNHLVEEEGQTLANLAEAYAAAGDHSKAIALHLDRRSLATRTGDRAAFVFSTANIGITYFEVGNKHEALKFLGAAADEFRTLGMTAELERVTAYIKAAR